MGGSICDVLPAAAAVLGLPAGEDRIGLGAQVGDARRLVIVLVDGLGYELLPALAPVAPLLAAVAAGDDGHQQRLDCTFPSTTPTSLVSFATGVEPGEHGVLGFRVNIPGTDDVLTHIAWRGDPPYRQWAPADTWFERLARGGIETAAVLPASFDGSGLTDAAYRGTRFCGVTNRDDYPARVRAELETSPLVLGYTAVLDSAAHSDGVGSPAWLAAARTVDTLLSTLRAGLPDDAALVVTADHGALNITTDGHLDLAERPDLAAGIRVVAGEPRVRYLHTVAGATDDVVACWQAALGDRAQVERRDEAIAAGRFGPVRPEHRDRIGDVVVTCQGNTVVLATGWEPAEMAKLVGFHGGDAPVETGIPLITLLPS
jgi:hypothetical protein